MKPVVAINEPCHESWEKMNPKEQGRHCDMCCKVVVDFTQMNNEAIADFLKSKTTEKICGRFREEQVIDLPKHKIRFGFKLQRFAAAVFLAFGSFLFASCGITKPHETPLMGDVAYIPDTVSTVKNTPPVAPIASGDTTKLNGGSNTPENPEIYKLGEVQVVPDTVKKVVPEKMIQGDVEYVPNKEQGVKPRSCPTNIEDPAPEPARVQMGTVQYIPPLPTEDKPK